MTSADKELEEQLLEAGNKLLDPPSSVDELLPLLDRVENCLSRVEQSPTKSMQNALSPSLKALVADKLLRHSDVDVKVAVASCISEITRITAPDAPYDDDQMKEVFQLIVSSFENLLDKSSPSYTKRASIVETVAKVRSCVVMLDLECDALIVEMFQHFFTAVREHHSESVFSSMEIIMTLVIEESEEISLDLLAPILASVKKDEGVLPLAKKLGERVLESCATKLKPYLVQAVSTLGISLDDYSKVLATICQETPGSAEQNDADESKSAKEPLEESTQVVKEDSGEAPPPQEVNPVEDKSPKPVMSNGNAQTVEDSSLADPKPVKKQDGAAHSDQMKGSDESGNEERNNLDADKVDNTEEKPEQTSEKKGRMSNSAKAEPSEGQTVAVEKEAEKLPDSKPQSEDILSSPKNDHSAEAAGQSENDKETDVHVSSPKAVEDESEVVASRPTENLPDENRSKKSGRGKKKDGSAKGGAEPPEDDSKKVSEETSDTEAKPATRSAKKTPGGRYDRKKTAVVDSARKGSQAAGDPDVKKHSAKKVDESDKSGGGSSGRQSEDRKKRTRGKSTSDAIALKSGKDVDKEILSSPKSGTRSTKDEEHPEETAKGNLKRKRTPGKENESDTKERGEGLVGSRVKVYWPHDRMYYKGVIDSFDPAKKKHKVMYDDGDEEILNLGKEKWQLLEDEPGSDKEEESDQPSPDASPNMPSRKKGKANAGDSIQRAKVDSSSKSGGAKSGKSKGASTKSAGKSKGGSKVDSKSKISKSDEEVAKKSKDNTTKSGSSKSVETATKTSIRSKNTDTSNKKSKSKDEDVSASKPSAKPKQETPKTGKSKQETSTVSASKGKTSKSGAKSNINGSGKMKSGSLKAKDSEKDNSGDSTEEVEDTKGKSASSSKAQVSEGRSGKKRRRG